MKKYLFLLVFLVTPFVSHAQTGHFVFVSQGVISAQSTACQVVGFDPNTCEQTFITKIGSGWAGTTTSAALGFVGNITANPGGHMEVLYTGYTDASYVTSVGSCSYIADSSVIGNQTSGFIQLVNQTSGDIGGGSDCVLDPSLFYTVQTYVLAFQSPTSGHFVDSGYYWTGSPVLVHGWTNESFVDPSPIALGMFSLIGLGFQITPTASSTGLFLSGAQEFCNGVFGTTTGAVFGIGTDIANGLCQTGGYLFVPTPLSLQQFGDLTDSLQTRLPFSYVFGLAPVWSTLVASTTLNFPVYSANYADAGIGSTSPLGNILPNFTVLSTTTVQQYAPAGTFATLRSLLAIAIIVGFGTDVFFSIRKLITV